MIAILPQRLSRKITISKNGCWLWNGSKNNNGYGQCRVNKKLLLAHRYIWEITNGPIPEGLHVLHKCDVPNCVNPEHLFLGDHQANMNDMKIKGRMAKGEGYGFSKLTLQEVFEIRNSYQPGTSGEYSQAGLAQKYHINQSEISRILNHKRWNLQISRKNEGSDAM